MIIRNVAGIRHGAEARRHETMPGIVGRMARARRIGAAFFIAGLLAGCATPPGATAQSGPAPAACSNEGTTAAEGAAALGVIGAGAGLLFGHSASSALIGAGAGAAGGAVAGYMVGRNNCNVAITDAALQQQIADADAQTAKYQQAAAYYDNRARAAQITAAALAARYRAGKLSSANYRAEMATYQRSRTNLQMKIGELQASQAQLQQEAQAAGSKGGALTAQAQAQAETQSQLQDDFSSMSQTLASVPQA